MKQVILSFTFIVLAQLVHAQSTPAELVAQKIAGRMKDTLNLSTAQTEQIYQLNMQLHHQKTTVRTQVTNPDVLAYEIQKVENTRDSLYKGVLNEEKYLLYKQKKQNLVNNN